MKLFEENQTVVGLSFIYERVEHSMGDRKKAKLEIRLKAGEILDGAYDLEQLCFCYNSS